MGRAGALLSDAHTETGQAAIFVLRAEMEGSSLAAGARWAFNVHLAAAHTTTAAFTSSLVTVKAVTIEFVVIVANSTSLSKLWVASVSRGTSFTAPASISRGTIITCRLTVRLQITGWGELVAGRGSRTGAGLAGLSTACYRVSIKTRLTALTPWPSGVVETLQTPAGL